MALPTVAAILSFQCGYLAEIQVTPVLQITHLLALSTVQTECDTLAVQINALPGLSDALDACPTCSPFVCNPVVRVSESCSCISALNVIIYLRLPARVHPLRNVMSFVRVRMTTSCLSC